MNALDQAFIRAFAKSGNSAQVAATRDEPATAPAAEVADVQAGDVDAIYQTGALYHSQVCHSQHETVPSPHVATTQWSAEPQLSESSADPTIAADEPVSIPAAPAVPTRRTEEVAVETPPADQADAPIVEDEVARYKQELSRSQPHVVFEEFFYENEDTGEVLRVDRKPQPVPPTTHIDVTGPTFEVDQYDVTSVDAAEPPVSDNSKPTADVAIDEGATEAPGVDVEIESTEPISDAAAESDEAAAPITIPIGGQPECEPAWEVDGFDWPEMCAQLYRSESTYFDYAGTKLATAADEGLHVLGVTSSQRGEGRTTLALCLARSAAAAGVKVALLDADLHRPRLAVALGIDTPCDWRDAITQQIPLGEVMVRSIRDRLSLLPLAVEPDSANVQLADPRVTRLLRQLQEHFELVIVDMPPVGDPNSPIFEAGEHCPLNAAILVRDMRIAVEPQTLKVVRRLYAVGVDAVGLAQNYFPRKSA